MQPVKRAEGRAHTGHDGEDLLHELEVVGLVELGGVVTAAEHEQQLEQQVEAGVRHIALGVAECPHDGIDDQLELARGHGEERGEARIGYRPQQVEELQPVLRIVLHMHAQRSQPCLWPVKAKELCSMSAPTISHQGPVSQRLHHVRHSGG